MNTLVKASKPSQFKKKTSNPSQSKNMCLFEQLRMHADSSIFRIN